MSKKSNIAKFVEGVFDLYGISKYNYFYTYNMQTSEKREIPLFPDDAIDSETIEKLSIALGLTEQQILDMDEEVAKKYWRKYPFFKLYKEYMDEWYWESRYQKGFSAKDALIKAIFTEETSITVKTRYDYENIKKRLIDELKKIDEISPGIYHHGAEIIWLKIETEVFMSFPQLGTMLQSFFDLVENTKQLFFKALQEKISQEEILEYNFLVTWLHATDIVMPNVLVTYDNICVYRQVYLEEALYDFFSYVKIKSLVNTAPWRCKEFFANEDIVKKFITIFPETKAEMRKFLMAVSKFSCDFVWSDAETVSVIDEYEEQLIDNCDKQHTLIYLDKSNEEMFDWEIYVNKLNQLASPSKQGGLQIPIRECTKKQLNSVERISRRLNARYKNVKNGGNSNE